MSNFVIAAGHTASGNIGCGVIADLDESNCTREISQLVAKELKSRGHEVNLLKIDKSNSYRFEDCYVRAEQANELAKKKYVDLYVEIHINAGGGTGSEVLTISKCEIAKSAAERICKSLSQKLEIPSRGIKSANLIVLKKTNMPAILVECLFADSSDAEKYNADLIARAIVDGLLGENSCENNIWKLGWNRNYKGWWYCTDAVNKCYYTSKDGWKLIDGDWFIFDDNGYALQNTWYHDENDEKNYYLGGDCRIVKSK